jgi:hypothetical protein
MAAKVRTGSRPGKVRRDDEPLERNIGCAVNAAIKLGFVVGREVLVGRVPGLVVGYNIAGIGSFLGNAYPLVVRTALGVTKCAVDEVSLA